MKKRLLLLHFSFFILHFSLAATAQTCVTAIPPSAPDERYIDHGDGTVSDLSTGLMWQRCSAGQSGADCATGSASSYTWQQALQHPQALNAAGGFAGYSDWRLPNLKELSSLIEQQCYIPAINLSVFPATGSSLYWSASPYAFDSSFAWYVLFSSGSSGLNSRSNNYHVRLVRAGQE